MLKWVDETKSRRRSFYGDLDSISLSSIVSSSTSCVNQNPGLIPAKPQGRARRPDSLPVSSDQIVIEWKSSSLSPTTADGIQRSEDSNSTNPSLNLSDRAMTRAASNCDFKQRSVSHYDKSSGTTVDQLNLEMLKVSSSSPTNLNHTKNKLITFWKNLRLRSQSKGRKASLLKSQSIADMHRSELTLSPMNDDSLVIRTDSHFLRNPSPTNSISQRHSLKKIRKSLENKKPRIFSHAKTQGGRANSPIPVRPDTNLTASRTSNQANLKHNGSLGSSDTGFDTSPELDLKLGLGSLEQEFTEAVIHLLSMHDENISDISDSEETTGDVFCYDTDTVVRKSTISTKPMSISAH